MHDSRRNVRVWCIRASEMGKKKEERERSAKIGERARRRGCIYTEREIEEKENSNLIERKAIF